MVVCELQLHGQQQGQHVLAKVQLERHGGSKVQAIRRKADGLVATTDPRLSAGQRRLLADAIERNVERG